MNAQSLDMFAGAVREVADGPRVSDFQGLTKALLKRLSEKGLTLEECAGPKMLNRSVETLQRHCVNFGIAFPDYTPANMRKHVQFVQRGDFMELTGEHVGEVAKALEIAVTERDGAAMCAIPAHGFERAKADLRKAGFQAKKAKPAKKRKAAADA